VVLREQLAGYENYIETDYSRFDRTISRDILESVQNKLLLLPNQDPLYKRALELTLFTSGSSSYGVRYQVDGTRCSGDAHTSLGNGLINAFNTFVCMRHINPEDWTSVHEGDDGIIAVRNGKLDDALAGLKLLQALGFVVKQDVFNQLDDVSFCGRHFYHDASVLFEHADILRSLDKFHTTTSNINDLPMIRAKAMSYYETDAATPLIGPLCYALIKATDHVSFGATKNALHVMGRDRWLVRDMSIQVNAVRPLHDITMAARISCARRTNLAVGLQLSLEAAYLQIAARNEILVVPRIHREWFIREDGHVHGDPAEWVRRT
jgi:hypothetical protein